MKAQFRVGLVLVSLIFFGAGCSFAAVQKFESKSAQGEGVGELKTEWRTNWETTRVGNGHLFNLVLINHEKNALTDCRITLDGATNEIKDLLFRVSLSGNTNEFSEKIDKIEPEKFYEIGDNIKSTSFTSQSNMPNLDQPIKKVKLECAGKSSEWHINYQ